MSYYKSSYSAGDTFIDYSGNKYTVITGGNTPSTPFDSSNIVNDKIVWGSIELQERASTGGGIPTYTSGTTYNVTDTVIYDDRIYQCITAHTATSTFDNTKWKEISTGGSGSGSGASSFELADNDMINCGSLVSFNASPIVDEFSEFSWDFSNARLDSTNIKYEPSSLVCSDSSKCYSICDDMLSQLFASGFTIDFWARIDNTASGGLIYIGTMGGEDAYQILEMYNVGSIYTQHVSRGTVTCTYGTWQYWSLNFYNNKLYIFIDGKLSLTCDCSYNSNSHNGIYINAGRTSERYFNGYISDFKITKHVKHANIEFEPPLDKPKNTISYNFLTNGIYRETSSDLVLMAKNDSNIFSDFNMIALNK